MLGLKNADSGTVALDEIGKLAHFRDMHDGGAFQPANAVTARVSSFPERKAYRHREIIVEPFHEIAKRENVFVAQSALASQPVRGLDDAIELLRLPVSVAGDEADEHKAP